MREHSSSEQNIIMTQRENTPSTNLLTLLVTLCHFGLGFLDHGINLFLYVLLSVDAF